LMPAKKLFNKVYRVKRRGRGIILFVSELGGGER
jgi:hypothetical protein